MKTKVLYFIGIISVLLVFVSFSFAQKSGEKCVIKAWIEDSEIPKIDDDVRSQPKFESKSLLEIPFVQESGDEVALELIGYSKNYLKIKSAVNAKNNINFQGTGWILARRVAVVVKTANGESAELYALPKTASKKVGKIPNGTRLDVAIYGFDCFGLRVEYDGKTGWLSKKDICGEAAQCQKENF